MALSASRIAAAAYAALTADSRNGFSSPLSAAQQDMVHAVLEAVATAVVAEIVANGTVTVTSVSGVQTGAGVSGPGTGVIL